MYALATRRVSTDAISAYPMHPRQSSIGLLILSLMIVGIFAGCGNQDKKEADNTDEPEHRVVAASYPLQYLTQRIAGDEIDVRFPVPENVDPRTWKPKVSQIQELQSSDLVIVNGPGATYAKWLVQVSLLDSKVCNSASELPTSDFILVEDYHIVHTHGPEGEHSHQYMVPYTWMDPAVAKKQAAKIYKALTNTYPKLQSELDSNFAKLNTDLDQLIEDFRAAKGNGTVIVSDPNIKFLTRALGLEAKHLLLFDINLEAEVEQESAKLQKYLEQGEVSKLIIIEQPGAPVELEKWKTLVGKMNSPSGAPPIVSISLLDQKQPTGDYLSAMRAILEKLKL